MKLLLSALVVGLLAWLAGGTWFWVCQVKQLCDSAPMAYAAEARESQEARPSSEATGADEADSEGPPASALSTVEVPASEGPVDPMVLMYQGKTVWASPENIRFGRSAPSARLDAEAARSLDELASFLASHPERELEITGIYAPEERRPGTNINLGLARANFVADELIKRGLAEGRIIKSFDQQAAANLITEGGIIRNGVNLQLLSKLGEENAATPAEAATSFLRTPPPDLYFNFNSSELNMTPELRNYITQAIQYLKQHPEKKLRLIGHTDIVGEPDVNLIVGENRAVETSKYFLEFGLDEPQIVTDSKGSAEPKASNTTKEGRRLNRRVEIRIE